MARQEIILGTPPAGLGGDPPRTASMKINAMTQELYDKNASLGTAAFASTLGSVTNGAIIERGSSVAGEWIKFNDGTQIAWHAISVGGLNVAPGSSYYSGTISFPVAFVGPRFVSFTVVGLNAGKSGIVTMLSVNNAGSSPALWAIQNFVTANGNAGNLAFYEANLLAVGRWK